MKPAFFIVKTAGPNSAVASSIKIALFVAPVLVFARMITCQARLFEPAPYTTRTNSDCSARVGACLSGRGEPIDGRGDLLGVYVIPALAFYNLREAV